DPHLDFTRKTWPLIMVHSEYDFIGQLYCRSQVEIKTWVSRIGEKSFSLQHEGWQEGTLRVSGSVVLVYYNFILEKSEPLPAAICSQLEQHLLANSPVGE
ncbi:MAG: acyl-CoA thioesterase, partial [Spirochaetaceae bacterium]|nr:acyl-CoA thioesterase [Spirochaetaceae bacterium]